MGVEGRGGKLVYNSIWIGFEHEEISMHIKACALAARP